MAVKIVFHGYQVREVIYGAGRDYTDLQSKLDVFTEITGHQLYYQVVINPNTEGQIITYYVTAKDDETAVEFKLRWL